MACEHEPAAQDAVLLTQAELQLEDGQYEEALASLHRVRARHPTHAQALKLLGELHFRRKEWAPLAELLPLLRRRGNMSAEMLDAWSVDTYGNIMTGVRLDRLALDKVWKHPEATCGREPRLTLTSRHAWSTAATLRTPRPEIPAPPQDDWSDALIDLYGELPVEDPAAHLKRIEAWLKERPEMRGSACRRPRVCPASTLGKPGYLEASLAIGPTGTYRALGSSWRVARSNRRRKPTSGASRYPRVG